MRRLLSTAVISGLTGLGAIALTSAASMAADPAADPAAGKAASGWQAATNAAAGASGAGAGTTFDDKQLAVINEVDAYFKKLDNVQGKFIQYGGKRKRMRGKYYIKQPGRFRFNYNRPSRMVIVSDGRRLVVQDHDLNTEDQINLNKTPFRVLLRKNVNLLRDAKIKYLEESDSHVVMELVDKNPSVAGGIKLFFKKTPGLELKEWITTDVQGLKTRIELVSLERVKKLSSSLFKVRSVMLPKF